MCFLDDKLIKIPKVLFSLTENKDFTELGKFFGLILFIMSDGNEKLTVDEIRDKCNTMELSEDYVCLVSVVLSFNDRI